MSIVVNRVQREIVSFSSVPNRTTSNTVLSSFFATLTELHFNGHFPTLNLAVLRVTRHTPWCLTAHLLDQKVVLRVLSLTRTLSVDTLFRDRANRPLHEASLSRHVSSLAYGKRLAERGNGSIVTTLVVGIRVPEHIRSSRCFCFDTVES